MSDNLFCLTWGHGSLGSFRVTVWTPPFVQMERVLLHMRAALRGGRIRERGRGGAVWAAEAAGVSDCQTGASLFTMNTISD